MASETERTEPETSVLGPVPFPTTVAELRELFKKANAGDVELLPQVRELIRRHPREAIRPLGGDVVAVQERAIVGRLASGNEVRAEAIREHVHRLRSDLAGPAPTPIESVLVDRVVVCWLQLQQCDLECLCAQPASFQEAHHRDRLRNRAHRRFLSAIKMLATIRRCALPAIQVNIADQQVNLTGG